MIRSFVAVFAIALCATTQAHPSNEGGSVPRPPDEGVWREARNCGLNCLYVLLHSAGVNPSYDELRAVTPVGSHGSSLSELCAAAGKMGFPAAAYKTDWEGLLTMPLPVVVHLDHYSGNTERAGHFMILTRVIEDGSKVELFDAGIALRQVLDAARVRKLWSGYVLLLTPERSLLWPYCACAFVIGFVALPMLARHRARRRLCAVK
jgi:hypothetical protein